EPNGGCRGRKDIHRHHRPQGIHPVTPLHPSVNRRSTHGGVALNIAVGPPSPRISCLRSSFTNRGNSVRAIGGFLPSHTPCNESSSRFRIPVRVARPFLPNVT